MNVPEKAPFCSVLSLPAQSKSSSMTRRRLRKDTLPWRRESLAAPSRFTSKVKGLDDLRKRVEQHGAKITMPLKTPLYGMQEFAFEDPDGRMITIALRSSRREGGRVSARPPPRLRAGSRCCPAQSWGWAGSNAACCSHWPRFFLTFTISNSSTPELPFIFLPCTATCSPPVIGVPAN